jgi:catechol 2,3-dioxygenase-like lactoylglutathione lyase family enzyme
MPHTVRHVLTILAVDDLSVSVAFYRAAFEWETRVETPVYVEFDVPGGSRIGIYAREPFGRNPGLVPERIADGDIAPLELYFHAGDLVAAIARLKSAGARELSPLAQRAWGNEAAYFRDPSGHVLVLARTISASL